MNSTQALLQKEEIARFPFLNGYCSDFGRGYFEFKIWISADLFCLLISSVIGFVCDKIFIIFTLLMMDFQKGEILCFDKPLHWTSFDLVNKVRNAISRSLHIQKLKVGHAGTLDPLATGVMILCTGKATKRIEEFQGQIKEYIATLCLGATTPSFDLETAIDSTYETSHITKELVERTLSEFLGKREQIPPAFSACRINGEKAYKYVRKGLLVTLNPRWIFINELELLSYQPKEIQIRVVCSKGTYVRALARDIGFAMYSGAYLSRLTRTKIGYITLNDCLKIENLNDILIVSHSK